MSVINRSKTYILPLLSDYIEITNRDINNIIINTYLEIEDHYNSIAIHCKYLDNEPEYEKFEASIFESDLFIDKVESGETVTYILEFPQYYIKEYYLFKKGLYSEFGDDCKVKIIRYWNKILGRSYQNIPVVKKIRQILYKDPELNAQMRKELKVAISLEQELGEAYNIESEMFNLKKESV